MIIAHDVIFIQEELMIGNRKDLLQRQGGYFAKNSRKHWSETLEMPTLARTYNIRDPEYSLSHVEVNEARA